MSRPPLEVADLIRAAGAGFLQRSRQWISWKHVKVLLAIARCRTAALGGHLDQCTRCGHRLTRARKERSSSCHRLERLARLAWPEPLISARERRGPRGGLGAPSAQV